MVKYSCERCGKEFKQKGHYMKHLQRKTPCDNIKDTIESNLEAKLDKLIEIKLDVGDLGKRTVESIIVHHADFVSFEPFKA